MKNNPNIDDPLVAIARLEKLIEKLTKENIETKKMATAAMRDCKLLKIEIQRLNTRLISNENDIRHVRSKR